MKLLRCLNNILKRMGVHYEESSGLDVSYVPLIVSDKENINFCKLFCLTEVWKVVKDLPGNKVPGPNCVGAKYYKTF